MYYNRVSSLQVSCWFWTILMPFFRYATKDSLVIIDELGRGTSPKEGLAYAIAMSEMLIRSGARVYFSTHFTKLGKLPDNTTTGDLLTESVQHVS